LIRQDHTQQCFQKGDDATPKQIPNCHRR
jgi:hypothetical protein